MNVRERSRLNSIPDRAARLQFVMNLRLRRKGTTDSAIRKVYRMARTGWRPRGTGLFCRTFEIYADRYQRFGTMLYNR